MSLHLQPVQVATNSSDNHGLLVFYNDSLVAVLVQLSDDHEDDAGKWFLEVSFGRLVTMDPPIFADLDDANIWIERQLSKNTRSADFGNRTSC